MTQNTISYYKSVSFVLQLKIPTENVKGTSLCYQEYMSGLKIFVCVCRLTVFECRLPKLWKPNEKVRSKTTSISYIYNNYMKVYDRLDFRHFAFPFADGTELCYLLTAEPWDVHFMNLSFSFCRNHVYWLNITPMGLHRFTAIKPG